jgi:hypothetical protein
VFGTFSALLVDSRLIDVARLTAPFSVTVQPSLPGPVNELEAHVSPASCTAAKDVCGIALTIKLSRPARIIPGRQDAPRRQLLCRWLQEDFSSATLLRPKGEGRRQTCISGTSKMSAFAHSTCARRKQLARALTEIS